MADEEGYLNTDYESFGLVDEKGNLTNAGALLADESPVRHSRLFCTRWNGLNKSSGVLDALDEAEYEGSVINLWRKNHTLTYGMKATFHLINT